MTLLRLFSIWIFIIIVFVVHNNSFSQTQIHGKVIDSESQEPLAYVNIGIKEKNIGSISKQDGTFSISIPSENLHDCLTFSIVGYSELVLFINGMDSNEEAIIRLEEKATQLQEIVVIGEKSIEKKYGIKRRGTVHFTDGIFKKDDSFEIGQVIRLGGSLTKITSLNIYINSSRPDSAEFRINFYRYDVDENMPKERIVEKNLLQRHSVIEGWLKFDLSDYNVLIRGDVLVALEFIPETKKDVEQILYEVKIGGSSRSFCRKTSLGQWSRPPHHYCLYVTALTDKDATEEIDDEETLPTFALPSDFSDEPFSLFVRLPENYSRNRKHTYPVVYLLDGNAYFDAIANSVDIFFRKKKILIDPIVVGIGYENAYVMDSLRNRDYTFPSALPADSIKISGQGDKFYNFIRTRIIKQIDSAYRTDKRSRTLMGHSLGGFFVLYALSRNLTDSLVFSNFIAASPSIYYHDNYLIDEIGAASAFERNIGNINLYLTIGELEVLEDQSNDFKYLSRVLKEKSINFQTEVYKNLEHLGTAIPTFEDGIRLLMRKRNAVNK